MSQTINYIPPSSSRTRGSVEIFPHMDSMIPILQTHFLHHDDWRKSFFRSLNIFHFQPCPAPIVAFKADNHLPPTHNHRSNDPPSSLSRQVKLRAQDPEMKSETLIIVSIIKKRKDPSFKQILN